MGKASGKILIKENNLPIKNLRVSLFEVIDSQNNVNTSKKINNGLGSATTDSKGYFEIIWAAGDIERNQSQFILLRVYGPESPDSKDNLIYESSIRKANKEVHESYVIEITSALLKEKNITQPESPIHASKTVSSIRKAAIQAELLELEWEKIAKTRVKRKRISKDVFENKFKGRLLDDITTVPKNLSENSGLVIKGDPERTVEKLTKKSLEKGVSKLSGTTTNTVGNSRKTRYFLTEEQRLELESVLNSQAPGNQKINQSSLDAILLLGESATTSNRPVALSTENDLFENFFQNTVDEDCATEILSDENPADDQTEDTTEVNKETLTKTDIKQQLSKVMSDINSPQGTLSGQASQDDVTANISGFSLKPGPADTPALYDFQKLHIAFDYVWKEFLDERIEPLAQAIYMSIVERGGDPTVNLDSDKEILDLLNDEEFLINAAKVQAPPSVLYSQKVNIPGRGIDAFDINGDINDFDPPNPLPPPPPGGGGIPPRDDFDRPVADTGQVLAPTNLTLIQKLRNILRGRYAFKAFGADSKSHAINFGLVVTYRQRWEPVTYQVGELHKTITLAPGESRKYTRRTKLVRKRAEKEVEKNTSILKDEFDVTTRAESEIVRKARSKTNFNVVAEGTYNFGIASGDSTTTADTDAESTSDEAKKAFREAVIKSSQEYRQERTLDISTEETYESENTESGEIKNPNNEITVTYLFFELQRRFRINEKINKATPVLLVAQDLPKPNQIDETFLIKHGWILKRALLDDMYLQTLAYVAGPLAGDKVARAALYIAMENHRNVVDTLKDDLYAMKEQASEGYEALRRAVEARISEVIEEDTDGFFSDVGDFFGGGGQSTAGEQAREEAARAHEQRAVEQVKQLTMALQREISAYTQATEAYTKAHRKFKEWELRIVDLLVHIKENILHYMQAIWAYEHPDQRFLRLHDKKAPSFIETNGGAQYTFLGDLPDMIHETVDINGDITTRTAVEFEFEPNFEVVFQDKTLVEIADLDTLLGFKGNYMIFPLKESNPLTDFMLTPYLDAGFRLLDPHDPGNISREDFARYVCYLSTTLEPEVFDEIRPELLERFRRLLLSTESNGDEIIVPTGSAYIEAITGKNALLEDFKLRHRAVDLINAQEDVREASLENIRRAARILGEDLSDPHIEAKYVFEGGGSATVIAPAPGGGNP